MWLAASEKIHAPEISGEALGSHKISLSTLRGRVVLLDFWDYTCVNCLRTLPYVEEWHCRYRDLGLSVIGIHSPEFQFARGAEHVQCAITEFGVTYPVLLDNEFQIWHAYANRCWPAKYLIDQRGYVRYYHFGEGAYSETEEAIQRLLLEINGKLDLPQLMKPIRQMDAPGARCLPVTPEVYLGFVRGHIGNQSGYAENAVQDYQGCSPLAPDTTCLDGPWFSGRESIMACPIEARPSRLRISCSAAEVNLVASPPEDGEAAFELWADERAVAPEERGGDVELIDGLTVVRVNQPRMYRLIKSREMRPRLIEISTITAGLELYAFTFVSCV